MRNLLSLFAFLTASLLYGQGSMTIFGPDQVCAGEEYMYEVNPIAQSETYVWTVLNGGFLSKTQQTLSYVSWTTPGSHLLKLVVYDNQGNPVDSGRIEVTVVAPPEVSITTTTEVGCDSRIKDEEPPSDSTEERCFLACEQSQAIYQASGNGTNYDWTVAGGQIVSQNANQATVQWGSKGRGSISVTVTDTSGCSTTESRCVEIIESPDAAISLQPDPNTCTNRSLFFNDASTTSGGSSIIGWTWEFGDGSSSNDQNPNHTYESPGNYQVILTVENECHCTDSDTIDISVDEATPMEIDCPAVVCENELVNYNALREDDCGDELIWFTDQGTITGQPTTNSVTVQWDQVGSDGYGYLSVVDPCASDCPQTIEVPVIQSEGSIQGPQQVCEQQEYIYQLPRWPGTFYDWTVTGDAQIYSTDQPNEIALIPDPGGSQATLRCTYDNPLAVCGGASKITLDVLPEAIIEGPQEICAGSNYDYEIDQGLTGNWELQDLTGQVVQSGSGNPLSLSPSTPGDFLLYVSGSGFCSPPPYPVKVREQPEAPSILEGPDTACQGVPYTFNTGPTQGGTTLNWAVTGGQVANGSQTASGVRASITFTGSGPYLVKTWRQYQADTNCVSDTTFKTVQPRTVEPTITGPQQVCANNEVLYQVDYGQGKFYSWQVSPPSLGTVANGNGTRAADILWNDVSSSTSANIVVEVRECGTSFFDTLPVQVKPQPVPAISAPDTACALSNVSFSVSAPSGLNPYSSIKWNFGDGNSSSSSQSNTASHSYASPTGPASYTVQAIVYDPDVCTDSVVATRQIVINPAPVATVFPNMGETYCDSSSTINQTLTVVAQQVNGVANSYQWLRDGNPIPGATSTSYTVSQLGSYRCEVTNAYGCTDLTDSVNFIVRSSACDGSGGGDGDGDGCPSSSSSSLALSFSANCGEVTVSSNFNSQDFSNPQWSGNPTSSIPTQAVYEFNSAGEFAINFSADSAGCTYSVEDTLLVPYLADFNYQVQCGSLNSYQVTLVDNSQFHPSYPINSYQFSQGGNPLFSGEQGTVSLSPGAHDITLTINGSQGACSFTKTINLPALPQADFSFGPSPACEGFPIYFTDASVPANGLSYEWIFDQNQGSVKVKDPAKAFPSDNSGDPYNITLIVTNALGCADTMAKQVTVNGNDIDDGVINAAPNPACEGTPVTLEYNPQGGNFPDTYIWQPDSFQTTNHPTKSVTVNQSGAYFATVTNANNCRYTTEAEIVEMVPSPNASIIGPTAVCLGDSFRLFGDAGAGAYQYQWRRNGNLISTDPNLSQQTGPGGLAAGIYEYELSLINSNPLVCSSTVSWIVEVHSLPAAPTASISILNCDPYQVQLTGSASGSGTFTWSDGQSGQTATVNTGGNYSLTYTSPAGCSSSTSFWVPKSPEEYIWIYPLGCYQRCQQNIPEVEQIDIPDPLVAFDSWEVEDLLGQNPGQSGTNQVPDAHLWVHQDGDYQYTLLDNNCSYRVSATEFRRINCECEIVGDLVTPMSYQAGSPCKNQMELFLGNSYGFPLVVKLSSPAGVFIPSSITVPPGGANFNVEFIPNPGVAPGSTIALAFEGYFYVDDQKQHCQGSMEISLPTPLCDNTSFKKDPAGTEDEAPEAAQFSLHPNPAGTFVNLQYRYPAYSSGDQFRLRIYALDGRILMEQDLPAAAQAQAYELALPGLSAGTYLLTWEVNGERQAYRHLVLQ